MHSRTGIGIATARGGGEYSACGRTGNVPKPYACSGFAVTSEIKTPNSLRFGITPET
jgi:hypothetical protein